VSTLDAALDLAARGCSVLPIWPPAPGSSKVAPACSCPLGAACKSPGKHPMTVHGLGEASSDPAVIRAWWSTWPSASVAFGLSRSGLVALDVDLYKGDGEKLSALEAVHGALPDTVAQRSGSGEGLHLVYLAPPFPVRGEVGGITVRGRNYVVAAPSPHYSGGVYAWFPGRSPRDLAPVALPPAWLEALRRPMSASSAGVPAEDAEPDWLRVVAPAERLARARAHLERERGEDKGRSRAGECFNVCRAAARGYALRDPAEALGLLLEVYNPKCRPPYEPAEIARRLVAAYDDATDPEWGALLRPHGDRLREVGLEPKPPAAAMMAAAASAPAVNSPGPGAMTAGTFAPGVIDFGAAPTASAVVRPRSSVLASEAAARDVPPIRSYSTGINGLDKVIGGGLSTRQALVVAAPPGDGKSGWCVGVLMHVESAKHPSCPSHPDGPPAPPVLYASTELETDEVIARFAAPLLDVSWNSIVRGARDRRDVKRVLEGRRLHVIGSEVLPRGDGALRMIADEAQAIAEQYGVPPAVAVDYLQDMVRGSGESELRSRVGDYASALRAMSQGLDCPMIVVCSVSRSYYGAQKQATMRESDDPRVYLAAAKESGDVDYAAATVLFLDVDVAAEGSKSRPARIAVAKARHGDPAFVGARFTGYSGAWSGDAAALGELAKGGRGGERRAENVQARVLEMIRRLGRPMSKRAILVEVGGNAQDVRAAVDALVDARQVVALWNDPETGRILSKDPLFALADAAPAPGAAPPVVDPALAAVTRGRT
jgi:hypothetical protein